MRALSHICGRRALIPRSLQIPLCYNRSDIPQYRGGCADVWKGEYQGRPVAAKVPRVYSTSDFYKIRKVGWLHAILNIRVNKQTVTHVEVLQGSNDVENTSPSERDATARGDAGQ